MMPMIQNEKLPDYNPEKICCGCGGTYPVWKLVLDSQSNTMRAMHNFCPANVAGKVVEICMECKIKEFRVGHGKRKR